MYFSNKNAVIIIVSTAKHGRHKGIMSLSALFKLLSSFGNSVETHQLTRIHFCAFSSWPSQNLALNFGIDLLSSTGFNNFKFDSLCKLVLFCVCTYYLFEGLMED